VLVRAPAAVAESPRGSRPWQLTQSPHTRRLMRLSKAGVAPRHFRLSTFCLHRQHCRRSFAGLRTATGSGSSSSYSTSAAIATNPVPRHGDGVLVHKRLMNAAHVAFRALSRQNRNQGRAGTSKPAHPIRRQPTLARITRPMMTRTPQTMSRNLARGTAWASLAPNQEPPLRLAARMMPNARSSWP